MTEKGSPNSVTLRADTSRGARKTASLTARENEVLELAARGFTDKQISAELGISRDTVASYWRRVLLKFDASSRTEVVAKHAQGLAVERIAETEQENVRLLDEIAERTASEARELAQKNLLNSLTEASFSYIGGRRGAREVLRRILDESIALSQSEYGFIGEVVQGDSAPYLRVHVLTDISWSEETQALYQLHLREELAFRNLDSLFGSVILTAAPVIAQHAPSDPRAAGIPPGHPPLNAFLGLPVFNGDELVGVLALANRPGGYDEGLIAYLQPILAACANLIGTLQTERERTAAEKKLRQSVNLVRALVDTMPGALLYERHDRRLAFVNQAFLNLFEIPAHPSQLVGQDCVVAAEHAKRFFVDPDQFLNRISEILTDSVEVIGEEVHFADGRILQRDFIPLKGVEGIEGYLWIYHDITSQARERSSLRAVLESSLDAVIVMNDQGMVTQWNQQSTVLFGFSKEEAIGKAVADLIVPEELKSAHHKGLARFLKTGTSDVLTKRIQMPAIHRDGTRLQVELMITPLELPGPREFAAFLRIAP